MEYLGYANRTFRTRFTEHNTAHYNNPESILAEHLESTGTHHINFPNRDTIETNSLKESHINL